MDNLLVPGSANIHEGSYCRSQVWIGVREWIGRLADMLCFALYGLFVGGSFSVILYTMDRTAPIPRLAAIMELVCVLPCMRACDGYTS